MPISSLTLETQNQEHQVIYSQDSKLDTLKEENVFAVYIYCTKKSIKGQREIGTEAMIMIYLTD